MNTRKNKYRPGNFVRPFLFKILSFLYPVRVTKTQSEVNPYLEVIWYNGKLMLNTRQANYSYGNLLSAFKEAFNSRHFSGFSPQSALNLGLGAGCVPAELNNRFPGIRQQAVEIDEAVVQLYADYFPQIPNMDVWTMDAMEFLNSRDEKYDLIIVDLYIDLIVPAAFHAATFIEQLANHCNTGGMVIFNQVVSSPKDKDTVNELMALFSGKFNEVSVFNKSFINHFIIGKKNSPGFITKTI